MRVFFWIVNILGLLAGLPLLYVTAFQFDSGPHLALGFFLLITNMAYPVLSLVAMYADAIRHLGLVGLGITCSSLLIVFS